MSANLLNALVASRRSFLSGTATLGSAWRLGCNPGERGKGPATGGDDTGETVDTDDTGDTGAGADCEDLTEGGELESVMAWLDETPRDLETRTGGETATEMQLMQNKMMMSRIKYQALAVLVVAVLLAMSR